ncbi:MAG TPA: hypothetical protein VGK01_00160 [Candidatus Angelobacter sp.]
MKISTTQGEMGRPANMSGGERHEMMIKRSGYLVWMAAQTA